MKHLKKFIAAFALFAAVAVNAQTVAIPGNSFTVSGLNAGTNNVATGATNTYSAFSVSDNADLGLQLTFKGQAAGTSTVQIFGYKSLDGVTYETTPSMNFLVTLNGTTLVTTVTNFPVTTAGNFKLSIGNTNASVAVTNIAVVARLKSPKVQVGK